jgi:branched-chain amino acid transport system ATP-binding protein
MGNVADIDVCRSMRRRSGQVRLQIDRISTFYGEAQALKDVSLEVHSKEVVAILGSNGAGKSTLVKTLTGLVPSTMGKILFDGQSIEHHQAHEIIRKGIACVPEGRELFGSLSVKENIELGTYSLRGSVSKEVSRQRLEMVFSLFPILRHRLKQKAETLSGGEQQMLALGRALMASPK